MRTVEGNFFFSENDVEEIEHTLFYPLTTPEIAHEKELERFKNEYLRMFQPPSEFMRQLSSQEIQLKELFEGFSTGILRMKEQSISELQFEKLAEEISRVSPTKKYETFVDENGIKFLVEKSLGVKRKIKGIKHVVENVIKPFLVEVF